MKSYRLTVTHLDPHTVSFETHDGKAVCYPVHDDSVLWFENAVRAAAQEVLGRSTPADLGHINAAAHDAAGRPAFVLSVPEDREFGCALELRPGHDPRRCTLFPPLDSPCPLEDILEKFCYVVCESLRPQSAPRTYILNPDSGSYIPNPEAVGLKLSDYALPFTVDSIACPQ